MLSTFLGMTSRKSNGSTFKFIALWKLNKTTKTFVLCSYSKKFLKYVISAGGEVLTSGPIQ